ncbi:uncharacterized protein [Labrus bergylta]|uniref:uncharacterized protein n=1 Tax=Labrus bergylta TaxID=56723 RepID=UPI0033143E50
MEVKWTDTNEKKHRIDNEQILQDSLVKPDDSIPGQTESLTQVTTFSEKTSQTTTDDTKVSSTVIFVDVIPKKTTGGVTGPESIISPCSVEKDQPKPPSAPLPPSVEDCTVYDGSESVRFINRGQESLKTMTVYTEPDDDGGVMSVFGLSAHTCAAASPPPFSLFWTSPATVDVWASTAASVNVLSAISASRLQSVWTLLWKSLKCFTTDAGCQ